MILNLFVNLPKAHPGASGNEYFSRSSHSLLWVLTNGGGISLTIHAYVAIALLLGAIALFVRSIAARNKSWIWTSGIAAFFTIGALLNGLSFVDYNENFSSMIMAICWFVAVGSIVAGLLISAQGKQLKPST